MDPQKCRAKFAIQILKVEPARSRLKVRHKPYFRLIEPTTTPRLPQTRQRARNLDCEALCRPWRLLDRKIFERRMAAWCSLTILPMLTAGVGTELCASSTTARLRSRPSVGPYSVRDAIADYLEARGADGRNVGRCQCAARQCTYLACARRDRMFVRADETNKSENGIKRWRHQIRCYVPRQASRAATARRAFLGSGQASREKDELTILKATLDQPSWMARLIATELGARRGALKAWMRPGCAI